MRDEYKEYQFEDHCVKTQNDTLDCLIERSGFKMKYLKDFIQKKRNNNIQLRSKFKLKNHLLKIESTNNRKELNCSFEK